MTRSCGPKLLENFYNFDLVNMRIYLKRGGQNGPNWVYLGPLGENFHLDGTSVEICAGTRAAAIARQLPALSHNNKQQPQTPQ